MKSLANCLQNRKKSAYQKLKSRFLKKLKSAQASSDRSAHQLVDRLRKLERQLGIHSSLSLRHWALAAALGIITTAASFKSKARGSYTDYNSWYHRRNDLVEYQMAPNMMVQGDTASDLSAGPYLGDGLVLEEKVAADFDNDGDIDFVGFGYYEHGLYVNDGSANFERFHFTPAADARFRAAVADTVDSDGDFDLLILEDIKGYSNSRIRFLENDGAGNFQGDSIIFDDPKYIRTLQTGNMDVDGDLDVLTAIWYGSGSFRYEFLVNDGTGFTRTPLPKSLYYQAYTSYSDVVRLGDFDGDGDMDILTMPNGDFSVNYYNASYYEAFEVFLNDGAGGFGSSVVTRFDVNLEVWYSGKFFHDIKVADVDNDGDLDVIVGLNIDHPNNDRVGVSLNDGSGLFGPINDVVVNGELNGFSVANFDDDADLELLVQSTEIFSPYSQITEVFDFGTNSFTTSLATLNANVGTFDDFVAGDFDNDGDDDLIATNDFEAFQFDVQSGTFNVVTNHLVQPIWAYDFELVDVDGDGDLDAIGNEMGQFLVNDGVGNFTLSQNLSDSLGFASPLVAIGDFDNDGDLDLVFTGEAHMGNEYYYTSVYPFEFSNGKFSSLAPVEVAVSSYSFEINAMALANLDADPELELAVVNQKTFSTKYLEIHDFVSGNFSPTTISETSVANSEVESILIFDVDKNGVNDVVIGTGYSGVGVFENTNGDATLFTQQQDAADGGTYVISLDTADFDGDGDYELLIAFNSPGSYEQRIAYNGSDTLAFSWVTQDVILTNKAEISDAHFADFDNDGDQDIVFASLEYGDTFMENTGSGFVEVMPAPYASHRISVGDVDGDGDIDLFVTEGPEKGRVRLLINQLPNLAPVILAQTFTINENSLNGSGVGTVLASDPEGKPVTFSISSGNESGAFSLSAGGELTVLDSAVLDYETTTLFSLEVEVSDGYNTSSNTVTVNLADIDEAPVVTDQSFTVAENASNSEVVGTVVAVDPEEGTLLFTISSGNEGGAFEIGSNSGVISVLDSTQLDFAVTPQYLLTVEVFDGTSTVSGIITIDVSDFNDAPEVLDYTFTVDENTPNGTAVGTIEATDPDDSVLAYNIDTGNESGAFAIDPESGVIGVLDSVQLDFEAITQYVLAVQVSDGVNSVTSTVTIDINDVNEAPAMEPYSFSIDENVATGTLVGTLVATDPEGDDISFQIVSGNESGAFALDPSSGVLSVNDSAAFDYESATQFVLQVGVADLNNSSVQSVTVDLNDVNEAPVFEDQVFSINENIANGISAGTLLATDPEEDAVTFTLISGNESMAFSFDGENGAFSVADSSQLDFESTPQFVFSIEASDGVFTVTSTATINLNDLNETPEISEQSFFIDENSPNGSVIGTVLAGDPEGDGLTYTISSGDDGSVLINTETGVLTIADSVQFDFELQESISIEVQVSDGEFDAKANVTININDLNESTAPMIADQTFQIPENPEEGALIGVIEATDPMELPLEITITAGNENSVVSITNGNELVVNDASAFNFEETPEMSFTVEATNQSETTTAILTVSIIDINETPVIEEDQVFRIEQGTANGASLGVVKATDPDEDVLVYTIVSGNVSNAFTINSNTGNLTVSNSSAIDFDVNPDFSLEINVSDGELSAGTEVSVRVTTLERDKTALLEFFAATNGANWTANANWSSANAVSASWSGVEVTGGRVTGLRLPNNNIVGAVPESFADLTGLTVIDLSGNEINGFPNVSSSGNPSLNLSENRLGITDLLKNVGLTTYTYAPQKRYGVIRQDTIPAGDDYQVSIPEVKVNAGNSYQWYLEDVSIPGANSMTYMINAIDINSMGRYSLEIKNPSLPQLTLNTRRFSVWAATDVFGKVFANSQGAVLNNGQVDIFRIFDGPFQITDSASLAADGTYVIQDVVLGDFILLVKPNRTVFPDVLQTYYVSTTDWDEADTLFLYEEAEGIDIQMVFYDEKTPTPGGADFVGTLESDFEDIIGEEDERIDSRRKVKRAGCSMRRFVRAGRTEEDIYELYAYVESDDEGVFNFEGIPEGKYLLNIQYPGVPMDPNSDIEFIIGGDKENQKFQLTATITENGIVVEATEVLYTMKPYLKDLQLYPNPTAGVLSAEFFVYRKLRDLKMEVLDVSGVKLFEQTLDPKLGAQSTEIDLTTYSSGVYFVVFTDEAGTFRQQVKVGKK
ncbi:cadherin domain-containing protein [Marinoscillum sp.]|uniref:cadherin domain-containing protein n=1 Tax=Marinoscillum sp. TaxID=2024838 RepID=UPI003BAA8C4E